MTLLQHTFDSGTDGNNFVPSAGIGVDGDGFNGENLGFDATITYDGRHTAPGTNAAKINPGSSGIAYLTWNFTADDQFGARGYYYFTSYPPIGSTVDLMDAYNSGTGGGASVWLNDQGQLIVRDGSAAIGAIVGTMTSPIPLNQWFRVEAQFTVNSGVAGAIDVERYDDLRGEDPDDTLSLSGKNFPGLADSISFGCGNKTGTITGLTYWMDEVAWHDTRSVIGPVSASKLATWTITGVQYDFAVAGVPLFAAVNTDHPYARRTAPYRKDQIDQSTEPGEQSLVYWWLRSQSSFHGGTGIEYEEPDPNTPILQYRVKWSEDLDLFAKVGQSTLMPTTVKMTRTNATTAKPILMGAVDSTGADCIFVGFGTSVYRYTSVADAATNTGTAVTWGGAATPVSACNDGTNYYIADSVGIWKGTLTGGAGTKIWNTGSANTTVAWLKQRLVAGIANKIYELTGVAGGPTLPADGAVGHIYSHPNTNWKWTCFAESPSALLAAGSAGSKSAIYKMQLQAGDGSVPTLGDPVIIAEFPDGELVNAMITVLGKYLAIGTTKGIRIATIDDSGDLEYGPLIITDSQPNVLDLATEDRFVYFTWTNMTANGPLDDLFPSGGPWGTSGIGVVDLSRPTDTTTNPFITSPGRYAYQMGLKATSGVHAMETAWAVTMIGASGRLAFDVGSLGELYIEHPTTKVGRGILRTGKIRFHTLEPKLFKTLKVRTGGGLAGEIDVYATTPDGTNYLVGTFITQGETDHAELNFPVIAGVEWMYLTFFFYRDVTGGVATTTGPTFTGYTVKALPAQKNQRNITLPVYLFDFETSKSGERVGYEGRAAELLAQLEAAEEARDTVAFQDFTTFGPETTRGRLVVIDDVTFIQTDPPATFSGIGGIANLTLRTVT